VRAQVDRTLLSPGESLQLTVTVENGEGEVDVGGVTDFKVFPRGTGTSIRIVNNVTSREQSHTYLLVPRREGRLTIPGLTVLVGGRSYRTEPIFITVAARRPSPGPDQDTEVWVESTLSAPQPFAGQQITYTFSLYQAVRISNATFQAPDFSGFSAEEIKERGSEHRIINGREYLVTHIHYLLTPLNAGDHEIGPAVLRLGIVRADMQQRRSPFDDFFSEPFFNRGRVESKVLQSTPLKVQVRPLPPYEGSEPFSGLVGRFEMEARLKETRLKVGDSTTLTILVQGNGNIMDAQAPQLAMPETVKSYADAPEEEIRLAPDGYSGKKMYRMALVPVSAGGIHLPSVRLTYFDVAQARYRTLSAELPALTVQPAADDAQAAPLTVTAEPQGPRKQKVAFTGRDILPPKEDLDALQSQRLLAWPLFLLWLGVPALAFGTLCLVQQARRRDNGPKARMRSRALRALKTARKAGEAHELFLSALYRSLSAAIYAFAGRSGEALTWKEAENLLCENGLDSATARQAAELLAAIETRKFSAAQPAAETREDLLERTRRMVRRLAP